MLVKTLDVTAQQLSDMKKGRLSAHQINHLIVFKWLILMGRTGDEFPEYNDPIEDPEPQEESEDL